MSRALLNEFEKVNSGHEIQVEKIDEEFDEEFQDLLISTSEYLCSESE
jgi:hypothetical protein